MSNNVTKVLGLAILIMFNINIALSQIPDILDVDARHYENKSFCSHAQNYKHFDDEMLANPVYFRPYDVLNYDIFLDWYEMLNKPMKLDSNGFGYLEEDDVVWTGKNTITLRVDTAELSVLEFDAVQLKILGVKVNGKEIVPVPPISNGIIKVQLDEPLQKDDTVKVEISYKHDKWLGDGKFRGFYLYPKREYLGQIPVEDGDSAFIEERIAYTMSEPQNGRYWLPSNDAPHDKAFVSMTVRVPKGYSVASNGSLKDIAKNDTAWTYHWQSRDVMTTYLIHAAASIFKEWSEWYHKITNPQDSVEIKYYVWQKDYDATATDGTQYNARWTFEQNVEQIETFARRYGEYPFEKYGIVSLQKFGFGGMEHQTITSINRVWLRKNARWGLAHELSHMWLGDLVTCKTWNDIWVNEGGATFSEAIWSEQNGGINAYFQNMLGKRAYYLYIGGRDLPPIYGLPVGTIFGKYAVLVYQKASWIYHQLRMMLGDEVFFPALQSLLKKYKFTSIDHTDFIKSFTEDVPNPPIDFDVYFTQWLMKKGHPLLSLNVATTFNGNGHHLAHITLTQTQEGDMVSDIFEIPVRLVFKDTSGNVFADTLWQKQRTITAEVDVPFFPTEIAIDTSFTLCEVDTIVTNVIESAENIYSELLVSPNPLKSGTIGKLSFGFEKQGQVDISIIDLLGRKEKDIFTGYLDKGNYVFSFRTDNLESGVYFIRVVSGITVATEKIIVY